MDKKLLSLLSLFFLAFGIFSTVIVFNKPLTQMTRAKDEIVPSASKSLIIAWPLTAKADGKTSSVITVFIRTVLNKPITNKTVSLTTNLGEIKNPTATTDNEGKAIFQLTSQEQGVAELQATVDNTIKVNQKLTIKFE